VIAMDIALNLGSITCAKPVLRPFQEAGYQPSDSYSGKATNYNIARTNRSRSEAYLMLGTAKSTTKRQDGSIVQARLGTKSEDDADSWVEPRPRLRGDGGKSKAACERDEEEHADALPKTIHVLKTVHVSSAG